MGAFVMGIVNVTPDSFSDGGKYFRPEEAIRRARNEVEEGAAVIDLGGESTRPGAVPIGWEEEWRRVRPVLDALTRGPQALSVPISVDTYHPETATRALAAGARIVNCVYPEPIPQMVEVIRSSPNDAAELIAPAECADYLATAGVAYYLDPMIGFGPSREDDLVRLGSVRKLSEKARVVVGVSRKRLVKRLTGEKETGKNLGGNLALALACAAAGATLLRVHDVRETVQALAVTEALKQGIL